MSTNRHLYSVQLFDRRGDDYCGCYYEPVDAEDLGAVEAEMHAAGAALVRDQRGQTIRCFWASFDDADEAANRAQVRFPDLTVEIDWAQA